jgi:predicted chitinase
LDCDKQHNVQLVLNACKKLGITNPYAQAAILAIASKESGFKMRAEGSYKNTSNERIRKIFRFARDLSDAELDRLKQNAEEFFSKAYGGRYGNAAWPSRDGYKYRGRGFNQITFKGNYESAAESTGQPLVEQPELLDQPQYAAEALAGYFTRRFKSFQQKHVAAYGVRCTAGRSTNGHNECLNGFTTLENAVLGVYHANAGLGKAIFTAHSADSTDGMRRALDRKEEFLGYVKANCNGDFSALKCE